MPRKRKVPVIDEEKENEVEVSHNSTIHHGPMYTIMSNVQLNETFHKKYIREMQLLYAKMDHDAFMFTFIKMIKSAMVSEETNEYAYTTLLFCAKFIAAYDIDDTHPVLVDTSRWLLSTISQNPHIRFRLCQFVNMILNALGVEAALDDAICDSILDYMLQRLRDINPNVRVQAILALQRLQCPDNPDDVVLRVYQFHLSSDPSPRVRQAVITSMGRNYNTIPYILDRLWDIDEKVRRHTYLHMSGYPVKAYKVSQRLQLLEQGLNDRSEMVKKVVTTIMLPQWLESYNKNYIMFVSALKLDASEAEVERFIKIAKVALHEIFKRQETEDLVKCVPFEEDSEFHKCVPHEKLTVEVTLYWQCLIEHLQAEMADELDMLIPELSTFCAYVLRYCESQNSSTDKFMKMEFQYVLLSLCQILYLYDLGDEIGRENLKKLISTMLKNNDLEEKVIEVIVKCTENLIADQNTRLQFFVEIIEEMTQTSSFKNDLLIKDRNLVEALLEQHPDKDLKLKLSSLKVKILDLEEQEMNYVEMKDYVQAHRITEEKNAYTEEYSNLLKPLLEKQNTIDVDSSSDQSRTLSSCYQQNKKVTSETILKSLQLAFYMVVSKNVKSLTPNVCKLYNEFIGRHIASNQIAIRDWALKCGTAYSMLYESLAKEIYEVLYAQFFKNHNIRIWKTSITCIFELLDRYGCSSFNVEERQSENKNKRTGRQLYNTLEFLDADDDSSVWSSGQAVDIIFMMSHFLDTCDDVCIISAIVNGFCRLILHDHIKNSEVLEKLLLRYFNPSTDPEINQILGVFLENLIQRKKQEYLHPCVLPTISQVISAPYESPLHEIKPETILRFVIDSTRPECCAPNANIHNKLALSFLQEMQNNIANKDLCKILSKELLTLQMSVMDDLPFKENLKSIIEKLIKCEFDSKTLKNIIDFKDLLDGVFNPPLRHTNLDGSDEEDKSDDETVSAITTDKESAPHEATAVRLASIVEEDKDSEAENLAEMATGSVTESQAEAAPEKEDATEKATEPETAPSQASVAETAKEPESEKEPETEKDPEKDPEPSTEPLSEAAPSTPVNTVNTSRTQTTPTTFGRENSTGLRYLRKSMNFSRSRLTPDDGPSPKIRIEARIDNIPSPAKVQKMNENTRQTRKNLRTMIRDGAAVTDDVQQSAGTDPKPTRENRKVPTARPASTSKKASKKKAAVQSEDSDDSEIIPPSPTSSAVTDDSSNRLVKKRVNRTLRYNNTQPEQEPPPPITKATRSNRNRNPANARPVANEPVKSGRKRPASSSPANESNEESVVSSTTPTITIAPQSIVAMSIPTPRTPMSNRLRAKNSNIPDKSVQHQKSTRSSLNKTNSPSSKENEPKTITDNSTSSSSSSSSSTEEEPSRSERINSKPRSPVEEMLRNSSKVTPVNKSNPRTPISNRLRAKNSNVPEKLIQRPKSTRSVQNKTNSPSSKENEPKSSTDSSSSSDLTSSSDDEKESSTKTPQRISQSRIVVTKSVEKRIRNDRNPVISLQRAETVSTGRVNTRNSARKDRQNNMIMTRKRLSLENVRSPSVSSPVRSRTPTQKKPTAVVAVAPPKTSKIPVNLALRSIKTNSKQQSSQHNSSGESSKSSSSSEDASSKVKASLPSKPAASSRIALLAERRAKPTLAASTRIVKSTRQMSTKTMLRKRNI